MIGGGGQVILAPTVRGNHAFIPHMDGPGGPLVA